MFETLFFHLLGIFCIICLYYLIREGVRSLRNTKITGIILVLVLGIASALLGAVVLDILPSYFSPWLFDAIFVHMPITARLYLIACVWILISFVLSSSAILFFRKYLHSTGLVCITLACVLLLILQPIAYQWGKSILG